ncbi:MAG: tRNA (guanine(10)-N(2))-dimethyltransferase [Candidatus Bathyarchaeota archaeon]
MRKWEETFPTEIIQEGKVRVRVPKLSAYVKTPSDYAPSMAPVFYNPVMKLNRDLAVLALQCYQGNIPHEISICEPLAGCGIRGLRFAKEVNRIKVVIVNDINEKAFQLAEYNVHLNSCSESILVNREDANLLLAGYGRPGKRFDAIDIDPFGSPVPYLDSALRSLHSGGFLAVTATDMAPLCGVHTNACLRRYGSRPLHTEYCHELAVRILAGSLSMTAARFDMGIKVIFSHSSAHYIRVYTLLDYGAKKANKNVQKMGYVFHCFKCLRREFKERLLPLEVPMECSNCGTKMHAAGPLWLGKLSDKQFCKSMIKQTEKMMFKNHREIRKILTLIAAESDAPATYYVIDKVSKILKIPTPPTNLVLKALKSRGFQACLSHFNLSGIKSNASSKDVAEVFLEITRVRGR